MTSQSRQTIVPFSNRNRARNHTAREVKGRVRGITADSNQSPNDEVLAKLKEIQSQFSSHMKAFGDRLNNVESATRSYQQSNVQQSATAGGRKFVPKGAWHTNVQQEHQPVDVSNGQNRTSTSSTSSQFTQQRVSSDNVPM